MRRKVWFSETLAVGLGASLLTWGEPDEDGFYTPTLTRLNPDAALREALSRIQDICKPNGVAMSGQRLWDGGAGGNKQRIWELCEVALAALAEKP